MTMISCQWGRILTRRWGTCVFAVNFRLLPIAMPISTSKLDGDSSAEKVAVVEENAPFETDPDAEFGGREARRRLERKLLWKLDLRMSILVFIYILNYVRHILIRVLAIS